MRGKTVYVVQRHNTAWNANDWRFMGVFSTHTAAVAYCESLIHTAQWRPSDYGEVQGQIIEGVMKRTDTPMWFNVMPVEIDDLTPRAY